MMKTFANPIIPGFYPDPSICRANEDYYLVTSSFEYFPGVPIFHSKDLINWRQIGHVLDRPYQLDLDGIKPSGGIYAPTIRYDKGTFYMITTLFGRGGNFIVTAENPEGPWSEPHWLEDEGFLQQKPNSVVPWIDQYFLYEGEPVLFSEAPGIDPSLFFDDDGKVYYTGNRKPLDGGKKSSDREIWLQELDKSSMKLKGEKYTIWAGCGGAYTEGPHLYKVNGYYYLITAEGGTFHDHAVMVARSRSIKGAYESNPRNPILTHRHLGYEYPIVNVGHADLVQTQNGEWWMVALASRAYGGDYTNLGRETFLAPVVWEDDWPVVAPGVGHLECTGKAPDLPEHQWPAPPFRDQFDSQELSYCWNFLRTPRNEFYSLVQRPGYLRLYLRPEMLSRWENPAFLGRRLQHINFKASAAMEFSPRKAHEEAGLVLIQNADYHFRFICTRSNGKPVLRLIRRAKGEEEILSENAIASSQLSLRAEVDGQNITFCFTDGCSTDYKTAAAKVNGRILSSQVAGGFVGAYIGLYASSNDADSDNYADFDWFEYIGACIHDSYFR